MAIQEIQPRSTLPLGVQPPSKKASHVSSRTGNVLILLLCAVLIINSSTPKSHPVFIKKAMPRIGIYQASLRKCPAFIITKSQEAITTSSGTDKSQSILDLDKTRRDITNNLFKRFRNQRARPRHFDINSRTRHRTDRSFPKTAPTVQRCA